METRREWSWEADCDLQFLVSPYVPENGRPYFDLYMILLTVTVEKGRNPQTYGRVNVLDKRNWSIEPTNHYKDWQKDVLEGVWACVGEAAEWAWQALLRGSASAGFASHGPSDRTVSLERGGAQGTRT